MSDYTIAVAWSGKDALADSDSAKVISGDDFNTEFTTARTAINSKADEDGAPTFITQSAGDNTTKVATTAYVATAVAAVTAASINALVYPVGSIYFNMAVSTNPATLLGMGTWVAYATGQVLVGIEGSGTFDALDESLGAETAGSGTSGSTTLSTSQIPSHTHTLNSLATNSSGSVVTTHGHSAGGGNHTTDATGGGAGHTHTTPAVSILQPSVTVYIWKRTA